MGADCKSVAQATKVRILHLPQQPERPPELRKRGPGAVCFVSPRRTAIEVLRLCARLASLDGSSPLGRGEFLRGRARPATAPLVRFIDEHRDRFGGVEICRVLTAHGCSIDPSMYHRAAKRPSSARAVRDAESKDLITRVHSGNFGVYGVRKVFHLSRPKLQLEPQP
jgi:hypothetical protein